MTKAETINQRQLRQAIIEAFNESELRTLCFDLHIDYEALPPGSKVDKARELVSRCLREQRTEDLITLCETARPKVAWRSLAKTAVSADPSATPPFMGLKYFDVANADLFFGREALTEELSLHLQQNNFLAIVGASGSGKSSLVRAGLVPALQLNDAHLRVHVFTPTHHPLETLATILTRDSSSIGVTAKFIDAMAQDKRSLHLAARRLVQEEQKLWLVIDQFEELFTLCRSEEKRQSFIDNLVTAVSPETNGPTRAVIALRADFYHHCAQYDDLRRLLEKQQRFIGAMSQTELRRAIEEPASQSGLEFELGLVDLLLRDVGASGDQSPEPGALPLLSHALLETWRRRDGKLLTFSGYTEAGGVQGAIAKTAESVFQEQLTPNQQIIARNIFLRLTELGEGTQDTRRRALINELIPATDAAEETQTVLNLLSAARLVTTDEESAEVAHEALIREWPTLSRWLNDDRDSLRLHRHLTESTQEWVELGRDPDELYRGTRLEQAQEWASQHDDELNDLEREFLAESLQMETQGKRRDRLIQTLGIGALLIILVGSILAAIVFSQQAQENQSLAQTAVAAQIESENNALLASNNEGTAVAALATSDQNALNAENSLSTVIAIEATEVVRAVAATTSAEAAQQFDGDGDGLTLAEELVYDTDPIAFDTDSDELWDGEEILLGTDPLDFDSDFDFLWDGEDNSPTRPLLSIVNPLFSAEDFRLERITTLTVGNQIPLYALSISDNNNLIAAGSSQVGEKTNLHIWLLPDLLSFDTELENGILATGISSRSVHAVVGSIIFSFDIRERTWSQSGISGMGGRVCSAAFAPDGNSLLVGGRAVWEYAQITDEGLRQIERESQNENTNACNTDSFFSYDGVFFGRIEDEGEDESVFIGEAIFRSFARPFNKSVSGTIDLALSPDGNTLVMGYENGRVELYDYSERQGGPPLIYSLNAHASMAHAIFSPDGTILATSSPEEGIVRLWQAEDGFQMPELDAEADGVTSLIFSQDGHYLLFGTTEGEVHVYGMPEIVR